MFILSGDNMTIKYSRRGIYNRLYGYHCPICSGTGKKLEYAPDEALNNNGDTFTTYIMKPCPCYACEGTGTIRSQTPPKLTLESPKLTPEDTPFITGMRALRMVRAQHAAALASQVPE